MGIKISHPAMLQTKSDWFSFSFHFLYTRYNYTPHHSIVFPEEPEIWALKQERAAEEKKTCLTEFTHRLNVSKSEGT